MNLFMFLSKLSYRYITQSYVFSLYRNYRQLLQLFPDLLNWNIEMMKKNPFLFLPGGPYLHGSLIWYIHNTNWTTPVPYNLLSVLMIALWDAHVTRNRRQPLFSIFDFFSLSFSHSDCYLFCYTNNSTASSFHCRKSLKTSFQWNLIWIPNGLHASYYNYVTGIVDFLDTLRKYSIIPLRSFLYTTLVLIDV